MAILWQQNRDSFDGTEVETSCTAVIDTPPSDSAYVTATVPNATDSSDHAVAKLTTAGYLPGSNISRVAFRLTTGTMGTLVGNLTVFDWLDPGAREIVNLYIDTSKKLNVFSAATCLSSAGFNTNSNVTLADNTEYKIEFAYTSNNFFKLWVNDVLVINTTGLSGATGGRARPVQGNFGIDHYDGSGGGTTVMKYRNAMVADVATDRLLSPGTEPVVSNKGTKSEKAAAGSGNPTSVIGFSTDGGNALVVAVALRRSSTLTIGTMSLVDNMGNTYTYVGKSENATGAAGSVVALFKCDNARALYTGATTFTLTTGSSFTVISLRVLELDVKFISATGALAAANGSSTAPSVTSGTPSTSKDRLWIGAHATQNPNTTTDTISSTGYTLSPVTTGMEGSSGSTATSNAATKLGYKTITNSAATQPFIGTLGTTGLWTAIVEGFEGVTGEQTAAVLDILIPATYTDQFNRADANPVTGYSASGMAGNVTTAAKIKSNQVTGTVAGNWAVYDTTIGNVGDDQYGAITPTLLDAGPGGHAWIDLRMTGEGSTSTIDGYEVEVHRGNTPDDVIIWRTVNGAAVAKAKIAYPWTSGWRFGAVVLGSTVYALVDKLGGLGWQVILTWTDPSPLAPGSSKVGFGGNLDNATTPTGGIIDDWSGGALTRKSYSAMFDITPTGRLDWQKSVAFTSTFTISPTGTLDAVVVDSGAIGPLTSTYTIAADGDREPVGAAAITSVFTLSPAGQVDKLGAAAITSTYTISPTGQREALGAAAITTSYTLAPTGTREPVGSAAITSAYTISPTGTTNATTAITSAYTIAADGDREVLDDVSLTVAFTLSADGEVTSDIQGAAAITSTYTLAAAGNNEGVSSAAISTTFTLAPTGTREAKGAVSLPMSFTLAPTGTREAKGAVNLHETFSLTATGQREALGGAVVSSTFAIAARGSIDVYGAASSTFTIDIDAIGEAFLPTQYGAASVAVLFAISVTGTYERVPPDVLFERIVTDPFRALARSPKPGARGYGPGGQGSRMPGYTRGGARR